MTGFNREDRKVWKLLLVVVLSALSSEALSQTSIYEQARRFPWFDYQQITKIRNLEAQGGYDQAYSIIRDVLKKEYPSPYAKGLEEKCRKFINPVECEMSIVRRMIDDDYKTAMDGIYNSVR